MDYDKVMREVEEVVSQAARRRAHEAMVCLPAMEKALGVMLQVLTRPPDSPPLSDDAKKDLEDALGHILGHLYLCAEDHPQGKG